MRTPEYVDGQWEWSTEEHLSCDDGGGMDTGESVGARSQWKSKGTWPGLMWKVRSSGEAAVDVEGNVSLCGT